MSTINIFGPGGFPSPRREAASAYLPPDRMPPHNIEAERGVLGGILLEPEVLPEIAERLAPPDFFRDDHGKVYSAILGLHARGVPVDTITLAEEMMRLGTYESAGGDELLGDLCNSVAHGKNAPYHADIVKQKAVLRDATLHADEMISHAFSNNFTAEQVLSSLASRVSELSSSLADRDEVCPPRRPTSLPAAAFYGVAGDLVRQIAPHTESDPVAILIQFLAGFGNMIGHRPCWYAENTRHSLNLYVCVVGNSSIAKKGTSWNHVRFVLEGCDPEWVRARIKGGFPSGEGLIWAVRDPIVRSERKKVQGVINGCEDVEVDPGVEDKRLLCLESEFGGLLGVMGREGCSLSMVYRQAWESGKLESPAKNSPAVATGAHVSVIGHVTLEELTSKLSATDAANGFANRFLWACAARRNILPHGGKIHTEDFTSVRARIKEALHYAKDEDLILIRDAEANTLWESVYEDLTMPRPGLLGKIVARNAPQAMRLACLYAILDGTYVVGRPHLEAALALLRYCNESATYIFSQSLGDPEAEEVLAELVKAGPEGLTSNGVNRAVFSGHRKAADVVKVLSALERYGLIEAHEVKVGRQKATRWAVPGVKAR